MRGGCKRRWILSKRLGTDLSLLEGFFVADVVAEVASSEVVHDEVEIGCILEGAFHVDEEGVVEHAEEFAFVDDWLDIIFFDDSGSKSGYFFLEISFIAQSRRSYLL